MSTLKVILKKSLIGVKRDQIAVAESMGLRNIGDVTEQPDNPCTQGKIFKISHLIDIIKS